ncbi:cytidine deaminase [Thermaurantimonas aggregans]|nr:cytidine deaminase [Thermaurantimonas aggregans]MCX8147954.1 cytidine deaminase [Thermaurantimonas aggregans]
MNKKEIHLHYTTLHLTEADRETQDLVQEAQRAASRAHAPYSKFKVGAALLLSDGTIITGSNQENAAYPSGLCAERVALFQVGHLCNGQSIRKAAIAVPHVMGEQIIPPCGACLQVFAEYRNAQDSEIQVILANGSGHLLVAPDISTFLPFSFTNKHLSSD